MNLAIEFPFSAVSLCQRGKQAVTQVPVQQQLGTGTCQRWGLPCWARSGLAQERSQPAWTPSAAHDSAVLQKHPRSPELSRQLPTCAVTVETRSPSSELPHRSPAAAGELSRLTYTPLLPAQAASFSVYRKSAAACQSCHSRYSHSYFPHQRQAEEQMSQTKHCLLDAARD